MLICDNVNRVLNVHGRRKIFSGSSNYLINRERFVVRAKSSAKMHVVCACMIWNGESGWNKINFFNFLIKIF